MNRNIAYIAGAVIVIVAVGWVAYSQLGSTNQEKSSSEETAKTAEQEQSADGQNSSADGSEENKDSATDSDTAQSGTEAGKSNNSESKQVAPNTSEKFVTLSVKDYGDIKIEVNYTDAPKSSENFVKLAKSGFYDSLIFHRIIPGFVAQGGDPSGNGTGGPGYTIPAEIKLPHTKYSVAMARQSDDVNPKRESSGSQFYIALEALPTLDGQYTVFGKVVAGQDIVDKLGKAKTGPMDKPLQNIVITKATVSEK